MTAWVLGAALALSGAAAPPVVPGFDRVADGELLLGELGCINCHAAEPVIAERILRRPGPTLSSAGGRIKHGWLKEYVADPLATRPGTPMPDLLAALPADQRARAVTALTAFLGDAPPPRDGRADPQAAARGEKLYHEVGCVACHGPISGPPVAGQYPLGKLAEKYTVDTLTDFLLNPLKYRPAARMPMPGLTDAEAADIAAFFLKGVPGEPNVRYEIALDPGDRLPDFATAAIARRGTCSGLDIRVTPRRDNVAVRFTGVLRLTQGGAYVFQIASDDGSRLTINGRSVVEVDGIHPETQAEGRIELAPGDHTVVVEWFNGGGERSLRAGMRKSGTQGFTDLGNLLRLPGSPADDGFQSPDSALVAEGRKLFASAGCAACHEHTGPGGLIRSSLQAGPLTRLPVDRDCSAARYDLAPAQRNAIREALARLNQPREWTNADRLKRSLAALNCYACHRRDGIGAGLAATPVEDDDGRVGQPAAADQVFRTTMPEMGDEGRAPPALDGAGAKMNPTYLRSMLTQGAKDRPYMLTRMPGYGAGHAAAVARLLEQVDLPGATKPPAPVSPALKGDGRLLVGSKGFACVKCHNFNKEKAEGVPGIDLTVMARRVRPEWFFKYLRDPQSVRPGTRMPTSWPADGPSPIANVLGGDPDRQITAIWAYLSDGGRASPPLGIGSKPPIELVVDREPIVYRNFLEFAGPRGIAVGHPEGVHFGFDAEQCRLAVVWHGAFLDVSGHRRDRGGKVEGPLGTGVRPFATGPAWAVLPSPDAPWPADAGRASGAAFQGYAYDERRRPAFRYTVHGIAIEDRFVPEPAPGRNALRRTLNIIDAPPGLTFRAAVGVIEAKGDAFLLDGATTIRVAGGKARVRGAAPRQELIVECAAGRSTIEEVIEWAP